MGWLGKILNVTRKEGLEGICMDAARPFWEVEGKTTFAALLRALAEFLPDGCSLCFEGGSPDKELLAFLLAMQFQNKPTLPSLFSGLARCTTTSRLHSRTLQRYPFSPCLVPSQKWPCIFMFTEMERFCFSGTMHSAIPCSWMGIFLNPRSSPSRKDWG